MINKNELRVIGLSRSGNHAIINWIRRQAPGRTCFLNCAEPRTNPFLSARPLDHGRPYEVNYRPFRWTHEQQGRLSAKDFLIYSYEDVLLGPVMSGAFEDHRDAMVGASEQRRDILILRDPFNLFASRKQSGFCTVTPGAMRIWKQHAREFLGDRRYLSDDAIRINYNRWVSSRMYRREIADRIGLPFRDEGIHQVPPCGGGSSFDGRRLHGRARTMRVHSRWRAFAREHSYWHLFDELTMDLSLRIFGASPTLAARNARHRLFRRASAQLA